MQDNMFIPTKLKIGFQERQGTFTGKLAYVTYLDEKNKLRKEKSWEGWRDKKIAPEDVDNVPTDGFVFNKGVQRYGDWYSRGRSMIRVHDPRGFEFEITVDNLIGILMHTDVSKREIVGKCVFAWFGAELVLLPVNSEAYQESQKFTAKQSEKLSARNLVMGLEYGKKKGDGKLIYVGYREWYENEREYPGNNSTRLHTVHKGKRHVFFDGSSFCTPGISTLTPAVADDIVSNYAEIVQQFEHTLNASPVAKIELVPFNPVQQHSNLLMLAAPIAANGSVELNGDYVHRIVMGHRQSYHWGRNEPAKVYRIHVSNATAHDNMIEIDGLPSYSFHYATDRNQEFQIPTELALKEHIPYRGDYKIPKKIQEWLREKDCKELRFILANGNPANHFQF